MTDLDVVTLGETMVSLRTGTPLRLGGTMTMTMAGAESNVAIGLARLGHTVRWGGRVGADEVGTFILRTMRAESVAVDTVVVDAKRSTGLMLAERRVADVSRMSNYRAGQAGALVSIDVNYPPSLWTPQAARPVLSGLVRSADSVIDSVYELGLVVSG